MRGLWIAMLVASCEEGVAASAHAIHGPDGKWAYDVECGESQSLCWREAAKACPQGYAILDRASSTWVDSRVIVGRGFAAVNTTNEYRGSMLIRCTGCWGPNCDRK